MKLTELQERALRSYAKVRTLKQISGPLTLQDFQEESEMSWAQLNGVVASLRQKEIVQVDGNGIALTPNGERWLIENGVVDEKGLWIEMTGARGTLVQAQKDILEVMGIDVTTIPHTIAVKVSAPGDRKSYYSGRHISIKQEDASRIDVYWHEYGHLIHDVFFHGQSLVLGEEGKTSYAETNGYENFAEAFKQTIALTLAGKKLYRRNIRLLAYIADVQAHGTYLERRAQVKLHILDAIRSALGTDNATVAEVRAWLKSRAGVKQSIVTATLAHIQAQQWQLKFTEADIAILFDNALRRVVGHTITGRPITADTPPNLF